MLPIEEVKKWLIENRTNEIGDLDLSCLDFSDFDGNVDISELKVKKSLDQSWQKVGGDLRQNYQEVGGRIFYAFGSLNADFKKMSPTEKGEFIIRVFGGDDGKVLIDNVDMSDCESDVYLSLWKVGGTSTKAIRRSRGTSIRTTRRSRGTSIRTTRRSRGRSIKAIIKRDGWGKPPHAKTQSKAKGR